MSGKMKPQPMNAAPHKCSRKGRRLPFE